MKKKNVIAMLMAMTTISVIASGCGCGREETPVETPESETVSESSATVVEVAEVPEEMYEEGPVSKYDVYAGRKYVGANIAHSLKNDIEISNMGSSLEEADYFDYLADTWITDTWSNPEYEESYEFHEDILYALDNGLFDTMTKSLDSYMELESKLSSVYTDVTPSVMGEDIEINESYITIAICDMAGFNGVNFTSSTTTTDAVNLGMIEDMAGILAQDEGFRTLPYVDTDKHDVSDGAHLMDTATGYDINYAMASAFGLDTVNASASLQAEGYKVFDDSLEAISLVDYDTVVLSNATLFAGKGEDTDVEATEETVESTEEATEPTEETVEPTEETQATPTEAPAANTYNKNLSIGDTFMLNGVEYTYGGINPANGCVVDNPAFYNHPEAAVMSEQEFADKVGDWTGVNYDYYDDIWNQDLYLRSQRWTNCGLYEFGYYWET